MSFASWAFLFSATKLTLNQQKYRLKCLKTLLMQKNVMTLGKNLIVVKVFMDLISNHSFNIIKNYLI